MARPFDVSAEASAAGMWSHVASCDACRAEVERETWVKDQLASLGRCEPPPGMTGSVMAALAAAEMSGSQPAPRRSLRGPLIGGGALGVVVIGALAIGVTDAPRSGGSDPVSPVIAPADLGNVLRAPGPDAADQRK